MQRIMSFHLVELYSLQFYRLPWSVLLHLLYCFLYLHTQWLENKLHLQFSSIVKIFCSFILVPYVEIVYWTFASEQETLICDISTTLC